MRTGRLLLNVIVVVALAFMFLLPGCSDNPGSAEPVDNTLFDLD